jgi:hypothetical protein
MYNQIPEERLHYFNELMYVSHILRYKHAIPGPKGVAIG